VILVLDNYDSFVHNIVRYVHELGATCQVLKNDEVSVESIVVMTPSHLIISPGPCTPADSGICVEVVRQLKGACPVLGICLGHQCIAEAHGARVVRAEVPMHGKTSEIHHEGEGILHGLPSPFRASRYHSLVVDGDSVPRDLRVTARVNGELRQDASTRDLVVSIPRAIEYLSRHLTLRPGDLILMGTPAGVGPLEDGDEVVCAVEGIGELATTIARA